MATPSASASAPAAPPSSAFPLTAAARFPRATSSSTSSTRASALVERRRTRRRRLPEGSGGDRSAAAGAVEKGLRLAFLEQLAERARAADAVGVADAIYDMVAAGLSPGPRSFHGLVAAHVLAGDAEGAMQSLRRELSSGVRPLHETFVALVRVFAKKGLATRGMEILAAMERYKYDIRKAWLILVEELVNNNYLEDANTVFLKGTEGGLQGTDEIYDLLIEEDCKAGDHSNALTVAYKMEASGRMATTFHFNCLLSVQATCGIPEIAFATFENMEYGGEDYMKPDTESYNWVIQAFTRATSYDRAGDVAELLGMMVEDHKRIQPNARTYALLVECFTKYSMVNEAIRHFRALRRIPGGTKVLYNEGNCGDPLSLYLRSLCLDEAFGTKRCSKLLLQLGALPCCTMAWLSFAQTAWASEGTNLNMVYEVGELFELGIQLSYLLILLGLLGAGTFFVIRQVLVRRELDLSAKELQEQVRSGDASATEYFELGAVMLRRKFYPAAIKYLQQAIQKWDRDEQDLAQVYNALGVSYKRDNKLDKAIQQFEKAVELQPGYVTAWNNLGDAYEQKKDLKSALKAFEEVLLFDPNNTVARPRRDDLKQRVGMYKGVPVKSEKR